ncbi:MAG: hypothetical protein WC750_01315 [Patescibacteria group bacterium]|jgi:hypothetical protein
MMRGEEAFLPSRSAKPDPGRLARQISKEAESRELADNPNRLTTPFDIQNYLEKTGRGQLCQDIMGYDKFKVDEIILDDLAKASENETARVRRLRNLALTNLPEQWAPVPQIPIDQAEALIQKKLTEVNLEARSKTKTSDDTETEDVTREWTQLLKILRRGPGEEITLDEFALRFLEEETRRLHKMMTEEKTAGNKTRLRRIEDLNKIRQGLYWRYLHPETKQDDRR